MKPKDFKAEETGKTVQVMFVQNAESVAILDSM
jgi:hypothetical protein